MATAKDRLQKKLLEKSKEIAKELEALNSLEEAAANFFNRKNYKQASDTFKQLLTKIQTITEKYPPEQVSTLVTFDTTPQKVNAHYMLGKCLFNTQQFDEAKTHFSQALDLNSEYRKYDIAAHQGFMHYADLNFSAAESCLRLAVLNPNPHLSEEKHEDAKRYLAVGLARGEFSRTTDETDDVILQQLEKSITNHIELSIHKGEFWVKLDKPEQAIACFTVAANLGSAIAHSNLSTLYHQQNRLDLEAEHLLIAAGLNLPMAIFNLAYNYDSGELEPYIKKNPKLALTLYEKAHSLGVMEACHNLGYKYVHGEDVEIDPQKGVTYLRTADKHNIARATAELAQCYLDGLCDKKGTPNLKKAKELYGKAYKQGVLSAGHNLASIFYQEFCSPTATPQQKQHCLTTVIKLWEELSTRGHAGSAFNLGVIFSTPLLTKTTKDFVKACNYYEQAGTLGIPMAYTNLAITILEEYLQSENPVANKPLLNKFEKAIEYGLSKNEPYALFISTLYATLGIQKDLSRFFETIKSYKITNCITGNKEICAIAASERSALKKIELILNIKIGSIDPLLKKCPGDDAINLATKFLNLGKLFKQAEFNKSFLQNNQKAIFNLLTLVTKNIEHLGLREIGDILYGIANIPFSRNQPIISITLSSLADRLLTLIAAIDPANPLEHMKNICKLPGILHSVAKIGRFYCLTNKDLSLSTLLLETIISNLPANNIPHNILSKLLYDIALLENTWDPLAAERCRQRSFFNEENILTLLAKVPDFNQVPSSIELMQFSMAISVISTNPRFKFEQIAVSAEQKQLLLAYLNHATIVEKIKKHTPNSFTTSRLQQFVAATVRDILKASDSKIYEEYHVGILPVDLFIANDHGNIIIQVDGPKHFTFTETGEKDLLPQECLRNTILESCTKKAGNPAIIHISFDIPELSTREELRKFLIGQFKALDFSTDPSPTRMTTMFDSSRTVVPGKSFADCVRGEITTTARDPVSSPKP